MSDIITIAVISKYGVYTIVYFLEHKWCTTTHNPREYRRIHRMLGERKFPVYVLNMSHTYKDSTERSSPY